MRGVTESKLVTQYNWMDVVTSGELMYEISGYLPSFCGLFKFVFQKGRWSVVMSLFEQQKWLVLKLF